MELWIRSQNKTRLTKVFSIQLGGSDENIVRANMQAYYSGCNYVDLGQYKTKERALEVLDEIEKILHPFVYLDNCIITGSSNGMIYRDKKTNQLIEFSTYVYEMPEE